ncbi:sugar nucleotide-binding protein, partial [Streptomyces sp. NPDC127079]|uniref:sugar nucleotide-binding protein n=1 Tax=Streptomyces sp. NPDC127079 TaxID=3347132 RepID=UPI00364A457C
MKWLVAGAAGMLGRDVVEELRRRGEEVVPLGRDDLDITSADSVESALAGPPPDLVVSCAAYNACLLDTTP